MIASNDPDKDRVRLTAAPHPSPLRNIFKIVELHHIELRPYKQIFIFVHSYIQQDHILKLKRLS